MVTTEQDKYTTIPDQFIGKKGEVYVRHEKAHFLLYCYNDLSAATAQDESQRKLLPTEQSKIVYQEYLKQQEQTDTADSKPPLPDQEQVLVSKPHPKGSMASLLAGVASKLEQDKQKAEEPKQADESEQVISHEVIPLRTHEAAFQLWTWEYNQKGKEWIITNLYQTGLYLYLQSQEFAKRYRPDGNTPLLIKGISVIETVTATVMRDSLKTYIESNPNPVTVEELSATYESRLEIFHRQQHLTFNQTKLEGLHTHTRPLLRDTAQVCYVPYRNGIVQTTAHAVTLQPYSILDNMCVWKSQVLNRDFDLNANGNDSHFARFIVNVANGESDRIQAFRSAIGYLLHHYGNESEGQAIICYDQELTDARRPEGGTGKGVFGKALQHIRPVAVIDGKKYDPNDKFCHQQVNQDTAVVWIDDPVVNHPKAERRFSLERFFSALTEGWVIEKKHDHAFRIPVKEGPKLLISSNVVMPNEGTSNVRRQFILEFSDHYKKQIRNGNEKPIQAEHGCVFFSEDWDAQEWQRFDRYMIGCIQDFLRDGLKPYRLRSADKNRLRQTAGEEFYEWVTSYQGAGLASGIDYNRDELFRDYKAYAGLSDAQATTRGFTNNVTQYAKSKGWTYERGQGQRNVSFTLTPA